jgi:hypothetical protein
MSNVKNDLPRWNRSLALLTVDLEKSLEAITKWLKKSELKVSQT